MQNTIQQWLLNNKYDDANVCINPVHYNQATVSAFAYERPAFAYMIKYTFDRL